VGAFKASTVEARYAMIYTNVFQFAKPGTFADPVTEVLRTRSLLAQEVEADARRGTPTM
jgi:hypothetical protein